MGRLLRGLLALFLVIGTLAAAGIGVLWASDLLYPRVRDLASPWDVALPLLLVGVLWIALLSVVWRSPRVGRWAWARVRAPFGRLRDWVQAPQAEAAQMRQQVFWANDLDQKDRLGLRKDLLQVETTSRGMVLQSVATTVQSITVLIAVVGLAGTCANLQLAQQGQISDRFTKAIEQLGSVRDGPDGKKEANLELRLGGIYALERIANDSPRDRRVVAEVLATYVRENARWRGEQAEAGPRADIQTVLSVLGRRSTKESLDLARVDLRGAQLSGANLEGASFTEAHLIGANLRTAHLIGANLTGADLTGADLVGADLRAVFFARTDLRRAGLVGADLRRAFLVGANLTDAYLNNANLTDAYLYGANLGGANLTNANLTNANLGGANLTNANLSGANLTKVVGLTREQLASAAQGGRGAQLPEGWR